MWNYFFTIDLLCGLTNYACFAKYLNWLNLRFASNLLDIVGETHSLLESDATTLWMIIRTILNQIGGQGQNLLITSHFPCPILLSWSDFTYIDRLRKPIPCNFLEELCKRQPRHSHKSQNDDIFSFLSPKLAKILLLIFKVDTFQNFCVIIFMQMKMLYELRIKINDSPLSHLYF